MSSITLPELEATLEPFVLEEDDGELKHIISNTDPLSMKKMFPLTIGDYKFLNREHLVAYVAYVIEGDQANATKVAKMKKRPAGNFTIPNDSWKDWAIEIGYLILEKASIPEMNDLLKEIKESQIAFSGKHEIWELGQDKTTASRASPPHHWGRNAWGHALTRYRASLLQEKEEKRPSDDLESQMKTFLESKIGKKTVKDVISTFTISGHSLWSSAEAIREFEIGFRRLKRENALPVLVEWAASTTGQYNDMWEFVSSLPEMDRIKSIIKRNNDSEQQFIESIQSSEKCARCGSSVVLSEVQDRSPDEPTSIYSLCYSPTCSTKRVDPSTGLERVVPLRKKFRTNTTKYLKSVKR